MRRRARWAPSAPPARPRWPRPPAAPPPARRTASPAAAPAKALGERRRPGTAPRPARSSPPGSRARSSRTPGRRRPAAARGSEASHWRSALLVGRSPKRITSSGANSEGRRRAIASYGHTTSSAVMGTQAKLRGRLGEDRVARPLGQGGHRRGEPLVELPAGDDQPPRRSRHPLGELVDQRLVGERRVRGDRGQWPLATALQGERRGRRHVVGARLGSQWVAPGRGSGGPVPGVAPRVPRRRRGRPRSESGAGRRRRPGGCRPRRTSAPRIRRASAGRWSVRRRSRAARVGGRP